MSRTVTRNPSYLNRQLTIDRDITSTDAGTYTGLSIDFDKTGASTSNNTGLSVEVTGSDSNHGIRLECDDGTGNDFKNVSSASNADYFSINTIEDGETTLTTVEDGGGSTAHLNMVADGNFTVDAVGDISLDADGDNITMQFGGATGQVDFSNENSGDVIIQQKVNGKDLVIQQFDGDEIVRFTDGGDVKVTNTVYFAAETANAIGDGATGTIDWNTSQKQKVTITGTGITCNFTNPAGACNLLLKVVQGDGSDVIATWDGDIKWPTNDTVPTLSTGNGDIDIISFYFDGTNYFGVASLDFA